MKSGLDTTQKQFADANKDRADAYKRAQEKELAEKKAKLVTMCMAIKVNIVLLQKNFYDIYSGKQYLEKVEEIIKLFTEMASQAVECDLDESQNLELDKIKKQLQALLDQHADGFEPMRLIMNDLVSRLVNFEMTLDEFEYYLKKSDKWVKTSEEIAQPMTSEPDATPVIASSSVRVNERMLFDLLEMALRPRTGKRHLNNLLEFLKQHPEITSLNLHSVLENSLSRALRLRLYDIGGIEEWIMNIQDEFFAKRNESLGYSILHNYVIPALALPINLLLFLLTPLFTFKAIVVSKFYPSNYSRDMKLEIIAKIAELVKNNKTITSLTLPVFLQNISDESKIELAKKTIDGYLDRNRAKSEIENLLPLLVSFAEGLNQDQSTNAAILPELINVIFRDHFLSESAKSVFDKYAVTEKVVTMLKKKQDFHVAAPEKIKKGIQVEIDRLFSEEESALLSSGDVLSLIVALERLKQLISEVNTSFDTIDCRTYGDVIKLWKTEKSPNGNGDQVSVETLVNQKLSVFGMFGAASATAVALADLENTFGKLSIR